MMLCENPEPVPMSSLDSRIETAFQTSIASLGDPMHQERTPSPVLAEQPPTSEPPSSDLWNNCSHVYGRDCTVLKSEDRSYLIGAQVSALLNKETFNLYRKMKVKGIELVRAEPEQISYLISICAVKKGTRSVTLIPFEGGAEFVEAELRKKKNNGVVDIKTGLFGRTAEEEDLINSLPQKRAKRDAVIKPWEILLSFRPEYS